ncbi:MAG: flippase [Myxococcota bacterium]
MTERDPDVSKSAAQVASGGGIVFIGTLIDKAFRMGVTWYLSGALGTAGFGIYSFVIRIITIIATGAPMAQGGTLVFFGARFRKTGARDRLKGTFYAGLGLTTFFSVLAAAISWLFFSEHPLIAPYRSLFALARMSLFHADGAVVDAMVRLLGDLGLTAGRRYQPYLIALTPLIVVIAFLHFLVGGLRAFKDMKGNALTYQIALPAGMFVGVLLLVGVFEMGVWGALLAVAAAHVFSLLATAVRAWRHYGRLLRDRTVQPIYALREQLKYSLPNGVMGIVSRLNLWMDIVMLGILSTESETGIYTVAASLATIGAMPATSLNTIFNPFISELTHIKAFDRLNGLLQSVTRWLFFISTPVFVVLLMVPDAALWIFDEAYLASRASLMVLVLGQVIWVLFAPANRIIPMAGHAMLNLINGLVALTLTVILNYWLIPKYGGLGAAMGTAITLSAWSTWRLFEVYHLYQLFPFSRRTLAFLVPTAAIVGVAVWLTQGTSMGLRAGITAIMLLTFAAAAWQFGSDDGDKEISERIKKRFRRLLGR